MWAAEHLNATVDQQVQVETTVEKKHRGDEVVLHSMPLRNMQSPIVAPTPRRLAQHSQILLPHYHHVSSPQLTPGMLQEKRRAKSRAMLWDRHIQPGEVSNRGEAMRDDPAVPHHMHSRVN